MALPTKVVDRLAWESPVTPGWTWHLLMFTLTIFFLVVLSYLGLRFGYEGYLQKQISGIKSKTDNLKAQVLPDRQTSIVDFYSQAVNLRTLLQSHVIGSKLFAWLEGKTEANVYFTKFSFDTPSRKATLTGIGKTIDDVEEQAAVFEAEEGLSKVLFSNATPVTGGWQFQISFVMDPSLFAASGAPQTP